MKSRNSTSSKALTCAVLRAAMTDFDKVLIAFELMYAIFEASIPKLVVTDWTDSVAGIFPLPTDFFGQGSPHGSGVWMLC